MKFSTAAILSLATGAIAMPWSTQPRNSHSEITLRVKVGESPTKARLAKTDICWLLCASDEIQCPEGWYASQQGECWTCCRGSEELGL
ncbi:hypothetical protein NW755_013452 [Fusarium falciforme]|uniref:Uncharacterized protein n=1 Tax=Fusarium falciforme TaxID=195108 RepID=A0A9W8UTV2_9HYPO|nr:hypothetical protein NW755_013452 [Fusarium falciforme]